MHFYQVKNGRRRIARTPYNYIFYVWLATSLVKLVLWLWSYNKLTFLKRIYAPHCTIQYSLYRVLAAAQAPDIRVLHVFDVNLQRRLFGRFFLKSPGYFLCVVYMVRICHSRVTRHINLGKLKKKKKFLLELNLKFRTVYIFIGRLCGLHWWTQRSKAHVNVPLMWLAVRVSPPC
jgi:hypothetical protein